MIVHIQPKPFHNVLEYFLKENSYFYSVVEKVYSNINEKLQKLQKLMKYVVKMQVYEKENAPSELLKTHYCVVSNLKKSQHVTHTFGFFFMNSKFLQII